MTDQHDSQNETRSKLAVKDGRADQQGTTWLWHLETTMLLIAPIGIWHVKIRPILILTIFLIALANQDYRQIDRRIPVYTGIYLVAMIALSALSGSPGTAVKGALSFASGFLMLIPGVTIGRHLWRDGIRLQTLIPTSILLAVYFMSPAYYEGRLYFGVRDNPNGTGYSLLFAGLILGIALASQLIARHKDSQDKATRMLLIVNLVAVAVLLLFSNHRTGWLAAICFAAFWLTCRFGASRVIQIAAYVGTGGLFAAFIVAFDRKDILTSIKSLDIRLSMWHTAIERTISSHPFSGFGFNTFREVFGVYSYQDISRVYNHPHNIGVDLFFSTGFIGLGLTLAYILSQIRLAKGMSIDRHNPISIASLAALVSLLIAFMFGRSIASFEVTGSLSCLYGVFLAQSTLHQQNGSVTR